MHPDVVAIWAKSKGPGHLCTLNICLSFPLKMHCDILFFKVATMLPGGLQVIGVFAVAPAQMMQSSQAKLRQVSGLTITNLRANAAYNKLILYFFSENMY